ncbi:RidA family protein [Paenarthrobacter sp. NPDC091711]|uniref:RidA family protein n=1 Tax=Paenarthrobacter sp. NPDC091711 TaxID=3364385 RepID=UPI003807B28D
MTSDISRPAYDPPYSASRRVGNIVWTSGVAGYYADRRLDESFEEQVHVTFTNLLAALSGSGATLKDVVSVEVFIVRSDDYDQMNALYRSYFVEDPLPVRTTVTVGLRPGVLFEMNAVAAIDDGDTK